MSAPITTMNGLEGVVVADTRLSDVDGEAGRLTVAGHDVESLAGRTSFEEVCRILWRAGGADPSRLDGLGERLGQARIEAAELLPALDGALSRTDGMEALRGCLAQVTSSGDALEDAIRVTGAVATFAAAWARRQRGIELVRPDPAGAHTADYLRMIRGGAPDDRFTHALDAYLVTVADHGMNASTFAVRVVISTGSDFVSAVVAGIGALKGPLHGGAPGPVLDMLDAIGAPAQAVPWLERELLSGRRIMGMGHRIYRVRDPRAAVLERAIEELERAGVRTGRLELARAVERAAGEILRAKHPTRPLHANVEFYTAVLLDALGLDRAAFTPTFAVGRVAGWCAHAFEQAAVGRLIRPASRYVGERPGASAG